MKPLTVPYYYSADALFFPAAAKLKAKGTPLSGNASGKGFAFKVKVTK